ncbi:hypothetical protein HOU08_gp288 [Dickeya phage vB_DsoM_JA29]|uniref:Uncharacterized protein n=1 Tax=Dickeya phage vB_DsoM_JA29 TaxID=2283031 RepID=A0A384ZXQ3_9CAUD|nr:hypothetical protein HOU08_gp288 [Dickeya phage vB_DsoM_JA29]AXG67014.1 hypothetical protein JA29_288 [Dickeya phage vB_DsoM_JA29]
MIYDPKNGLLNVSGIEMRTRPVLFQHKLWQNTEEFFKQAEQNFIGRYNAANGTSRSVLPISFVYVISKGGHRVRTSTLLEMFGYDGDKFDPLDPDYKFLLGELFARYSKCSPEQCFVQSFKLPEPGLLNTINFLILPCEDFFVGIVSLEG